MDQDIQNLFSTFETDGDSASAQDQGDGNLEYNVEGSSDSPTQSETDNKPEGEQPDEKVTLSKKEWDATQQMLAEFKGFMAASQSKREAPRAERTEVVQPQPQVDPRQQQAALENVFGQIGDEIITNPKEGVKKLFALAMQASAQQAAQYAAPAANSAVDLMIENFVTRKQSKDPLYEKGVGEKFESLLSTIDPRAAAGASRQQINEAMETLYQRAKGDWADEQYTKAQQKRTTPQRQDPTNYGGGKTAGGATGGRRVSVPDTWKKFALDAGIPEDQLTPEFFGSEE